MLYDVSKLREEESIVMSTQEAKKKALVIIQLLNQSKTRLAVQNYERYYKDLRHECKHEISMYVHEIFGEDGLIPCLFPDLPPPIRELRSRTTTARDRKSAPFPPAETSIRQAKKAKLDFD